MATAVIIGTDDYKSWPLTSAVNDALAFRDKLVSLGLVAQANVRLFTSPRKPGGAPADRKTIVKGLFEVYENSDAVDRFYFYYAGHGLLAFADSAMSQLHTARVAADAEDLRSDGASLIDVHELRDKFSQV